MSLSTPILTTSSEIDTRVDDCSATAVVMKDDADKAQMMSVFLIMGLPPQDEQRGTPTNPIVGNFAACCARDASGIAAAPPSNVMNVRRFMCGWPPPGKRKCSVPHRSRLQSCVRPHMMVSPSRADLGRSRSKVGLSFSAGLPLQTSHPAGVDPSHCPAFGTGRAPRERHHSV